MAFLSAAKEDGMATEFGDRCSAMGAGGTQPQNLERDFLRYARRDLGVNFQVCPIRTVVRDGCRVARDLDVGLLLPFEVAHWLWCFNEPKFHDLFQTAQLQHFG